MQPAGRDGKPSAQITTHSALEAVQLPTKVVDVRHEAFNLEKPAGAVSSCDTRSGRLRTPMSHLVVLLSTAVSPLAILQGEGFNLRKEDIGAAALPGHVLVQLVKVLRRPLALAAGKGRERGRGEKVGGSVRCCVQARVPSR